MMMYRLLSFLIALLITQSAFAQTAPDFMFRLRTNNGEEGPFTSWTTVTTSWDETESDTLAGIARSATWEGEVGSTSITLNSDAEQSGTQSGPGGVASSIGADYQVSVYVKGTDVSSASADLTGTWSASASVASSSDYWRNADYIIPFSSTIGVEARVDTSGYGTDSDSGGGSPVYHYEPSCSPTGA